MNTAIHSVVRARRATFGGIRSGSDHPFRWRPCSLRAAVEQTSEVNQTSSAPSAPAPVPADGIAPTIAVTSPTSAPTYSGHLRRASAYPAMASGQRRRADGAGSSDRGGSGMATGQTQWSGRRLRPVRQQCPDVHSERCAGNVARSTLTVTYTPSGGGSGRRYAATERHGDDPQFQRCVHEHRGLGQCRRHGQRQRRRDPGDLEQRSWRFRHSDRYGQLVGNSVALQSGANVLTFTARDAAGNSATAT